MRMEMFGEAVCKFRWGPSGFTMAGTLKTYECADRKQRVPAG
jgi:hypothetical protein